MVKSPLYSAAVLEYIDVAHGQTRHQVLNTRLQILETRKQVRQEKASHSKRPKTRLNIRPGFDEANLGKAKLPKSNANVSAEPRGEGSIGIPPFLITRNACGISPPSASCRQVGDCPHRSNANPPWSSLFAFISYAAHSVRRLRPTDLLSSALALDLDILLLLYRPALAHLHGTVPLLVVLLTLVLVLGLE